MTLDKLDLHLLTCHLIITFVTYFIKYISKNPISIKTAIDYIFYKLILLKVNCISLFLDMKSIIFFRIFLQIIFTLQTSTY